MLCVKLPSDIQLTDDDDHKDAGGQLIDQWSTLELWSQFHKLKMIHLACTQQAKII